MTRPPSDPARRARSTAGALYDLQMLHDGPRIGFIGLVAVALALIASGAALDRPGLEIGGGLLIVLAAARLLVGRL